MIGKGIDRRDFFKSMGVAGAGLGALASGMRSADAAEDVAQKVPRKLLGSTGEKIPILVMGGVASDARYDKRLHRAYENGIDYFDTALAYGNGKSHVTTGIFIKQLEDRKKVWITSKSGRWRDKNTLERDLDKCLEQLQTDYLDMYFMHGLDDLSPLDPDFVRIGDKLKKSKKTRFFGFSCHGGNVAEVMAKAAKVGGIDAIMFRYNFRQYGDAELNKAIDACKEAGIGLIAMKTQASIPNDHEKVVEFQSKNFTLAQAKLKSVWVDERIDAAISQLSNVQIVDENVAAAMSPKKLAMDEFIQLNRLAALTAPYSCQGCSQICESRIDGDTRVADTLRYLMYCDSYGEPEQARSLYAALSENEKQIDGVDFTEAMAACPQKINIAGRLQEAQRLLAW